MIEQQLGIKPELIEGGGGIYDIKVDGEMLFCKREVGRFPADEDVIDGIKTIQSKGE